MKLSKQLDNIRLSVLVKSLIAAGLLLLIVSSISWFYFNQTNADRQFWGMIDNSLKANSYTSSAVQSENGQDLKQLIQLNTNQAKAFSISEASQPGTVVTTEIIGTPNDEYIRYANVKTDQPGQSGALPDYSGLKNTWGRYPDPNPNVTDGQLYSQAAVGIVPVANLNADQRKQLIEKMKAANVYQYEVVSSEMNGLRRTTTFNVALNVKGYITVLKDFTKLIGLNQFDSVDPEQFNNAQPVPVVMKVDRLSNQLIELSYGAGERTEQLSGYGSRKVLPEVPIDTIPLEDLQSQLQSIQ